MDSTSIMQYIEFQKERAEKGEIAESTINNYYKSVKLFCEMNDILLNWKKIAKGKPQHRDYANDRALTLEEIKKLLDFPDRRIKVIVLVMLSSGIRLGAWDYLRWKHIIPIKNENNEYLIKSKLQERDDAIVNLSDQVMEFMKEINELKRKQ